MQSWANDFIGRSFAHAVSGGFALGHWVSPANAPAIEPHGHNAAHFIFVTAGEFSTAADGRTGGPILVFNPAGTFHADHFIHGGAFFSIVVPNHAESSLSEWRLPRAPTRVTSEDALVTTWRLMRASLGSAADTESICLELLNATGRGPTIDRSAPGWLAIVCAMLRDAAEGDRKVSQVAAAVGVHPIHLARTFRRFLHCTPGYYSRRHRVQRAATLLTQTRRDAAGIAAVCGYADQSHLIRDFQRHYGITPQAFRRAGS